MGCNSWRAALPILKGFQVVGIDLVRHAQLYRCTECGAYYEQVAEEWTGPKEVNVDHVRRYYPEFINVTMPERGST